MQKIGCREIGCGQLCKCGTECWLIRSVDHFYSVVNGKLEKRKDNKGNTEVDNYHVYCAPVDANGKASRCAVKDGAGPVEYRTPAEEYKHWAGNDTPGDGHASRSGRGDPKASPPAMIYTEVLSLRCFCCN